MLSKTHELEAKAPLQLKPQRMASTNSENERTIEASAKALAHHDLPTGATAFTAKPHIRVDDLTPRKGILLTSGGSTEV